MEGFLDESHFSISSRGHSPCPQRTYSVPIETLTNPFFSGLTFSKKDRLNRYQRWAQNLVQVDMRKKIIEGLGKQNLEMGEIKKIEGFFVILFYVLDVYSTDAIGSYWLVGEGHYAKYKFPLYIKHNLVDILTLLPPLIQDFLRKNKEFIFNQVAFYLSVSLKKKNFLKSWYVSCFLKEGVKKVENAKVSLEEILQIVFLTASQKEKDLLFLDDDEIPFGRNITDPEEHPGRLLIEVRNNRPYQETRDRSYEGYLRSYVKEGVCEASILSLYTSPLIVQNSSVFMRHYQKINIFA